MHSGWYGREVIPLTLIHTLNVDFWVAKHVFELILRWKLKVMHDELKGRFCLAIIVVLSSKNGKL